MRQAAARTRARKRGFIQNFLSTHPCVDCGEDDPVVLQFDHREGSVKLGNVSEMVGRALAVIEAEIAKCDVRCANCHIRKTAVQFGWYAPVMPR